MKEALLYEKKDDKKVLCGLCAHKCLIAEGGCGICNVRQNIDGVLYTRSYGNLISANIDPIEKKPLFHFLPGSFSYSISAAGCNFRCGFCQNWQISQKKEADRMGLTSLSRTPADIAREAQVSGCKSISYTYTEPTIFFEYALETGRFAKEKKLGNVFVTNGYMTRECLEMSKGMLDAANVDLKSFSDEYYKKTCGGRLKPVLETIEYMRKLNIWFEVTTLIVPGMNDTETELKKIASFLAGIDKNIPWHISKFFPMYKLDTLPSTPISILRRAYEIGRAAGLNYVYLGNVPGDGEDTLCRNCNELLIERVGYYVKKNIIEEGKCPKCRTKIEGIWNQDH
ncbi:MAG: AmmeMemoRadiSam system radical SAM enzyme [Candidatus Omnitrophica bacterium]|nr:AmmeMemoRadiSam system radical SAM enzyme [Candidatus Omnitrophota bacterium]